MVLLQDNPGGPELGAGDFAVTILSQLLTAAQHPAPLKERWRPARGKHYRPIAHPGYLAVKH